MVDHHLTGGRGTFGGSKPYKSLPDLRRGVLRGIAPKRRFGSFAAGGKGPAGPGRGAPGRSIESIGVNAAQWVVCPAEKIVNRAV